MGEIEQERPGRAGPAAVPADPRQHIIDAERSRHNDPLDVAELLWAFFGYMFARRRELPGPAYRRPAPRRLSLAHRLDIVVSDAGRASMMKSSGVTSSSHNVHIRSLDGRRNTTGTLWIGTTYRRRANVRRPSTSSPIPDRDACPCWHDAARPVTMLGDGLMSVAVQPDASPPNSERPCSGLPCRLHRDRPLTAPRTWQRRVPLPPCRPVDRPLNGHSRRRRDAAGSRVPSRPKRGMAVAWACSLPLRMP